MYFEDDYLLDYRNCLKEKVKDGITFSIDYINKSISIKWCDITRPFNIQ